MMSRRELALAAATVGMGALLWNTHQVVVEDYAHYITSGVNLMSGRGFTNPLGSPETWFPPVYPILIGLVHFLIRDGMAAGKLVSLAASVIGILAVFRVGRTIGGTAVGTLAAVLLIAHPERALFSVLPMTEALFSALLWSAVALYVGDLADRRARTAPLTGLLLGLAALTRPEGLLPAGLFCLDRAFRLWRVSPRRAVVRAGLLALVFTLVVAPYSAYLYRVTGKVALTGKSEFNLAVGRAQESGEVLRRIDPATLEIVINPGQGGRGDLIRYARNLRDEVRAVAAQTDPVWLLWVGLGLWLLVEAGSSPGVALVWAVSPLAAMPWFVMLPRLVLPYLPALMIAAACGVVHAVRVSRTGRWSRVQTVAASVLVIGTAGWTLAGAAQDIRSFWDPGREAVAERLAGEWLGAAASSPGAVAAVGGTVAYYAGLHQRYLTGDDLALVVAYMRARGIAHLAVSSRYASLVHPTVQELLRVDRTGGLRLAHAASEPGGEVCRVFVLDPALR